MKEIQAPKAKKYPQRLIQHTDKRTDNYFWLRERENPDVIDYLKAENSYFDAMTANNKSFEEDLFLEMKSRIKEDESSVPYLLNGYWYQVKFEEGKDYPIYLRKKDEVEAVFEVIFDVNQMAEGFAYYKLSGLSISPNNRYASFGVDTVSRRKYTIYVKDLFTGEILSTQIKNTTGGSTWANDNKTLFYTRKDEQTLRSNEVYKHKLFSLPKDDELIFREEDETFISFVFKTKSKKYIVIGSSSTLTEEFHYLSADDPDGNFQVFEPRQRGVEYSIDHYGDYFYITTNKDGAQNFKLMRTPVDKTASENWEEVIPHRDDVLLEGIDIFKDYLVSTERYNGLNRIHIQPWINKEKAYFIPFTDETYTAYTSTNLEFNTSKLRYVYNSLTTPASVVEFDMTNKNAKILKEQQVLDPSFDKDNYLSERIWATANDGTEIPISLVYKKGIERNGKNPCLLYGYGSYGHTVDPYFSSSRLSLLDRGFVFGIVHVRGGEYLGRNWYEEGKLLKKKNTFTDFIAASKYMIQQKYTSSKHLYAMGGSAGGLLMGVIINEAPELYKGVIAAVPFVDVVSTMLDETIPLTTGEYDEWGNPNEEEYYHYIKSYSPYDQVKAQNYPNLLITTGLYDSQVQYWEPAKWVAKLRELKTDQNKLLFHTNLNTGHGGASGRFEALKETARDYAFLIDLENLKN
ncbi:MAG: S9 family peptidase [Bacteroidota bacterium]